MLIGVVGVWKTTAERYESHIRCSVSCEETYAQAEPRKKGAAVDERISRRIFFC